MCQKLILFNCSCLFFFAEQGFAARLPGHRGAQPLHPPLHDVLRRAQIRAEDALLAVRGRRPLSPLLREAALLAPRPRQLCHRVRKLAAVAAPDAAVANGVGGDRCVLSLVAVVER